MKKINLLILIGLSLSLSGCEIINKSKPDNKTNPTKPVIEQVPVDNNLDNFSTSTPNIKTPDGVKIFNLDIYNFFFSQTELNAKVGDKVTINLTSKDGLHDFTLDEYNLQSTVIDTNSQTSVNFTVDKAGKFEFYSSIGSQKELGAKGVLIVSE